MNYEFNTGVPTLVGGMHALWSRIVAWSQAVLVAVLFGLGTAEAQPFAYVANSGSGNVSVINTATNEVVATIGVGTNPTGVAISPNGEFAYVTNQGSNNVSVIKTADNTVDETVAVGMQPTGVAFTPDGTRAYVTNTFSGTFSGTVSVIDTSLPRRVIATISQPFNPVGVAITPDGTRALVARPGGIGGTRRVSVINVDPSSPDYHSWCETFLPASLPVWPAVTPNGARVYVPDTTLNNRILVMNPSCADPVDRRDAGAPTRRVAFTPDGAFAYVTTTRDYIAVINTADELVVFQIFGVSDARDIAITPDGTRGYVTQNDSSGGFVGVIDIATNTLLPVRIDVGSDPASIAMTPAVVRPSVRILTASLLSSGSSDVAFVVATSPSSPMAMLNVAIPGCADQPVPMTFRARERYYVFARNCPGAGEQIATVSAIEGGSDSRPVDLVVVPTALLRR